MALRISQRFSDISLSFTRNPVTNDIIALRNEDAIKKSVMNLVNTNLGERFFNSLLGSSIKSSLFELNTMDINTIIDEEIRNLLNNFEPRVSVRNISVEIPDDSHDLNISIQYDIIGIPIPTQNVEFILQPTRV